MSFCIGLAPHGEKFCGVFLFELHRERNTTVATDIFHGQAEAKAEALTEYQLTLRDLIRGVQIHSRARGSVPYVIDR